MPLISEKDTKRLFKSTPRRFDPRKIGTIRLGALSFYRRHYDEAVADEGEGTGVVSMGSNQSVTISAKFASALFGLTIMGESVPRPGFVGIGGGGFTISQDQVNKLVTLTGSGVWRFKASDAFVFCMTAPAKSYTDAFAGDRVTWWIDRSDADEFSRLLVQGLFQVYPGEMSFPFLSSEAAQTVVTTIEHAPVQYAPREVALEDTFQGRLASMLFTKATFIKPSGPPRNFEDEEEYRFQFRRGRPDGSAMKHYPDFVDVPFSLVEHLVNFK